MASGQYGQWYGNAPNANMPDPSSLYGLAPGSTGIGGDTSPTMKAGAGIGGGQVIGGQQYKPYSPAWYAAMRANNTAASGAAGQAAGAYTQGAISQIPSLQGLLGTTNSALAGATSGAGSTGGTGAGGNVGISGGTGTVGAGGGYAAPIQVPDQSQAIASKFAAAKDTVGQSARAALDSLRGELGATGQLGGGAEATGVQNVINAGQAQLGDVTRGSAEEQAKLGTDVAEKNAELGVTERGQDVQAQEAQARLALENRQQLFGMLGLAMQGLRGGAGTGGAAPSTQLY